MAKCAIIGSGPIAGSIGRGKMKQATTITVALLALVALGHVLRLAFGVPASVGDWSVPMWVSFIGVLLPGGLAYFVYREHQSG